MKIESLLNNLDMKSLHEKRHWQRTVSLYEISEKRGSIAQEKYGNCEKSWVTLFDKKQKSNK